MDSVKLNIVTGASQNHFRSLLQFLETSYSEEYNYYVFDLGYDDNFNEDDIAKFRERANIKFLKFDYSQFPSYYNITVAAGEYAWKSACIQQIAYKLRNKDLETNHILLWCDSGNIIENLSLSKLKEFVLQNKVFSPESAGDIRKWTHPKTLEWFSISDTNPVMEQPNRNGAIFAFHLNDCIGMDFIDKFANYCATKECIAPEGSSRENHRQDQAVFTVMFYKMLDNYKHIQKEVNYFDITIHNDVEDKEHLEQEKVEEQYNENNTNLTEPILED